MRKPTVAVMAATIIASITFSQGRVTYLSARGN
jgi:hypothetical protein